MNNYPWERSSRGMGRRLMLQQGWDPQGGLGPLGQGRVTPIKAASAARRGAGIGYARAACEAELCRVWSLFMQAPPGSAALFQLARRVIQLLRRL